MFELKKSFADYNAVVNQIMWLYLKGHLVTFTYFVIFMDYGKRNDAIEMVILGGMMGIANMYIVSRIVAEYKEWKKHYERHSQFLVEIEK